MDADGHCIYSFGGSAQDLEAFGGNLRKSAESYLRRVQPEQFHDELERALKALQERARGAELSEDYHEKIARLHKLLAEKDSATALDKARKALAEIGDAELARKAGAALARMHGSLDPSSLAEQAAQAQAKAGRESDLQAMKRQLEETRAQLDSQRAEIEALRAKLESLKRGRGDELLR
jgi:chromosome segregation ATPase